MRYTCQHCCGGVRDADRLLALEPGTARIAKYVANAVPYVAGDPTESSSIFQLPSSFWCDASNSAAFTNAARCARGTSVNAAAN